MQLEILGNKYEVRYNRGMIDEDSRLGHTDMARGVIDLDPDMLPDLLPVVLIHEMLHVMIFMGHLQFLVDPVTKRHDEASIDAVSSLLCETLRANGMLCMSHIKGALDEEEVRDNSPSNGGDEVHLGG